jgi:hypothetical protein
MIIFFFKQKTSANMFMFYVISSQHNLLAHNHYLKIYPQVINKCTIN